MRRLFFIGIALLPLLFWPWSVWVTLFWIELLIIVGLVQFFLDQKFLHVSSSLWKYLLIFFSVILLSSIFGVDPIKSIFGNPYRIDGIWTLLHLIALTVFLSFVWKKTWETSFMVALATSAELCSVWAVIDGIRFFLFHDPRVVLWQGALGVSFGNPVFLAGYLVVTLPCQMYLFYHWRWSIIGLCLQIAAIFLTHSWAGYIGVALFFVGWIWNTAPVKFRTILLRISISVVALLFFGYGIFLWIHRLPISTLSEGRNRIFTKAIIGWKKRPIFGWGWANFDYVFKNINWPVKFSSDAYVDKAHSMLLEILATSGIVGLCAYVSIILYTLKHIVSKTDTFYHTLFLMFLLYLFHSQTNVISLNEELIFWIIVGIAGSGRI